MQLTIECDNHKDCNMYVAPIGRRIRGRFDAHRRTAKNPDNATLLGQWPQPVPGQLLSVDTDAKTVTIHEPIRDKQHEDIAALFKKRSIKIPEHETFEGVHIPSMLHTMKRAVDCRLARVVEGTMPDKIEGEPLKSFIAPNELDPEEQLRETLKENTQVMRECIESIVVLAKAIAQQGSKK